MNETPSSSPAIKTRMAVWLLGIILGVCSVFGALSLRSVSFFAPASYLNYLPSLYFIALNTAVIALAEAFGFAFLAKRDGIEHHILKLLIISSSYLSRIQKAL
jgi:hypothetical protein